MPVMSPGPGHTPAYERSRHRRKKVEMLFAHLKRILRLGRLRLAVRRRTREFLLAAPPRTLESSQSFERCRPPAPCWHDGPKEIGADARLDP